MIFKSQIKKTSNIMEATEYLGEYKFNHKWKAFLIENSKDIFVVNINKNNRDNENLLISIIKQDFISETSKSFRSISLDTILKIQNNNEFDSKIISRVKFDKYYNREEDSYVSNEKIKLFWEKKRKQQNEFKLKLSETKKNKQEEEKKIAELKSIENQKEKEKKNKNNKDFIQNQIQKIVI
jgi:hypothetical protein